MQMREGPSLSAGLALLILVTAALRCTESTAPGTRWSAGGERLGALEVKLTHTQFFHRPKIYPTLSKDVSPQPPHLCTHSLYTRLIIGHNMSLQPARTCVLIPDQTISQSNQASTSQAATKSNHAKHHLAKKKQKSLLRK